MAKTIIKALNKAKDAISEEFATDQDLWSKRLQRIQLGFQSKWQEVMTKFLKKGNDKTCDKPKNNKKNKNDDNKSKKKGTDSSKKYVNEIWGEGYIHMMFINKCKTSL